MKSLMNYNFSKVPAPQIQRSTFDRSCGYKTAFNPGGIYPIFLDEILPGDTMKVTATLLARMSTFLFPIMDNIFLDFFWFFVPNRLVWSNWEKFNGSQKNPGDSIDFTIPRINPGAGLNFGSDTIFDYFGLPTRVTLDNDINVLPFRCYNLIWNEWFRDQNLQDSAPQNIGDGPDTYTNYTILKRGKRHDYFSSCLPWPQKGDAVSIPLGNLAPVHGTGMALGLDDFHHKYGLFSNGYVASIQTEEYGQDIGVAETIPGTPGTVNAAMGVTGDPAKSGLVADLSAADAATINELRVAFQFQKILERDARGGTRYVEMLKAHFGVTSPDFRLQRPEYLGGSSQRMNISSVPQTSETGTTPQAHIAAYSVTSSQNGFNKSFTEHGYILGLVNVRADISYQQQLHKMWSRKTRFDFYLPALAHLGEQAVLNKEIFYKTAGDPEGVFGYQERWAELRYKPSMVTGAFRSNYTSGTLDAWHLALNFGSTQPVLNDAFIQDQPPIDRVLAVTSADSPNIILDSYFAIKHTRPLPIYSVPGNIDRF